MSQQLATFKVLGEYLEAPVLVRLRNGSGIKGTLRSYDQHLNLVIGDAEEVGERNRRLGLVLIRGDSVVMISPGA